MSGMKRMQGGPHGPAPKLKKGEFSASMKGMVRTGKQFLPLMGVAALFIIASVVISLLAPSYVSNLTDTMAEGITGTIDLNAVERYGFILMGMYAANALASYLSSFIMTTVSQKYSQHLRIMISNKINRLPLSYFDSHAFGDILSRVTNDVDQIGMSLQQSVSMIIQSIFMLTGVVIAMFIVSWQMALTALLTLPLMVILISFITTIAMPNFRKRQQALGAVSGIVDENYNGQVILKLFNAEDDANNRFEKENKKLFVASVKASTLAGMMQPFTSLTSYFAYAAIFLVGGLLIKNSVITFGTISAFMIYINLFQSPLSQIAQAMNALQLAAAGGTRVFEFLDEKEQSDETGKKRTFQDSDGKEHVEGQITFDDIRFSYIKGQEIIHGFSEVVKPGMKVAIVGPTGAGKTTIVNLLMRFYDVDSGKIMIDGVPTLDMPSTEIRDIFGMVLQDTWLFNGTIRENIVYNTKNVSDEMINDVLDEANLSHYISTLPGGLDYVINDPNEISSGQRQLITIARAMLKNAPLMILDEATSNVDTRTEERIQEAMDKLMKGRTSFVIAHRLSTIRNADIILVLKDGNIIESGNHEQLMAKNGFYASLYNSQFSFE